MILDQAINEQNKLKEQVYSLFRRVTTEHLSFAEYLRIREKRVYHKKLLNHAKEFVRGYEEALFAVMQNDLVVWGWLYNGVLCTKWDNLPDSVKKLVTDGKLEGHHFWKDALGIPTNHIFS